MQATRIPLEAVEEAPWNVNVMEPATFAQLLADMKEAGPERTDPIDTCSQRAVLGVNTIIPEQARFTADGAHRVRAAKQLKWSYIYEIFHPEIKSEEEARLFNYKRDADRGNIDSFKLAQCFQWFAEKGLTQEQIAKKFGVDRSTVSKKLALLGLDSKVQSFLVKKGFTVSHLEAISALPVELQRKVAGEVVEDLGYDCGGQESVATVRAVEKQVAEAKKKVAYVDRFKIALAGAKFPKCPSCGGEPRFDGYVRELPWVDCSSRQWDHRWNIQTGKGYRALHAAERAKDQGKVWSEKNQQMMTPQDASLPQHVKLAAKPEEFEEASWGFLQHLWPQIAVVDSCGWSGLTGKLKNGGSFSLDYSQGRFEYRAKGQNIRFNYAEVDKTTDAYKEGMRTRFTGEGVAKKESTLKEWSDDAHLFLEKYVPRGKK